MVDGTYCEGFLVRIWYHSIATSAESKCEWSYWCIPGVVNAKPQWGTKSKKGSLKGKAAA